MQGARKTLGKVSKKPGSQQQAAKMWKRLHNNLVQEEMKTKSQTFVFMVYNYDEHVHTGSSLMLIHLKEIVNGTTSAF